MYRILILWASKGNREKQPKCLPFFGDRPESTRSQARWKPRLLWFRSGFPSVSLHYAPALWGSLSPWSMLFGGSLCPENSYIDYLSRSADGNIWPGLRSTQLKGLGFESHCLQPKCRHPRAIKLFPVFHSGKVSSKWKWQTTENGKLGKLQRCELVLESEHTEFCL